MMKHHDPARFGCRLTLHSHGGLPTNDEIKTPLVVFVHGFTANGEYFKDHADYVQRSGYESAYFDYDSYVGINKAAAMLAARLNSCQQSIKKYGIFFVGHSMGGLVVRAAVRYHLPQLIESVKAIILLGTPNDGTLMNSWIVRRMIQWGEHMSNRVALNPYTRTPTCQSAKELTQSDPEEFLRKLNDSERGKPAIVPTLTISGGHRFLEMGGGIPQFLGNRGIQRIFAGAQNDGLVLEDSVNLSSVLKNSEQRIHLNGYSEYSDTNHSALARNQSIAILIVDFFKR